MAANGGRSGVDADTLEVGCLHVGLIGARNIRVGGGGMVDLFLNPQANPYCKITLGVSLNPVCHAWWIRSTAVGYP